MNVELIKKFKREFDWWIQDTENRSVWAKDLLKNWESCDSKSIDGNKPFQWCNPRAVIAIVINDEYAKFRMAEADGKVVQGYSDVHGWFDRSAGADFDMPSSKYRIKPDQPEWTKHCSPEKPVICRVWDDEAFDYGNKEDNVTQAVRRLVHGKRKFDTNSKEQWQHAEPITAADLHPFQREGWYSVEELKKLHDEYCKDIYATTEFFQWLKLKERNK